jgi:eukaryotic-like serine/threonine-protein kinase
MGLRRPKPCFHNDKHLARRRASSPPFDSVPREAPWQVKQIGPASDQYSLGAVFYELLTGRCPFEGPSHTAIAKAAGDDPPLRPRAIRPSIPRDFEAICLRYLEKDPTRRYSDAHALEEDLERWIERRPVRVRPIGAFERLAKWCRRNPQLAVSLATTLVLTVLLATGATFTRVIRDRDRVAAFAREKAAASSASQRQLAINEFERGRNFCERGDLTQGLLWLASGLEKLTPEMADLDRPIRSYIGSWLPHIHRLRLVIGHDRPVNSVAISPDGKYLLSGSGAKTQEGRAQVWDLKTGAAVGPPIEHAAGVMQVAYSPTGAFVATASLDKTARVVEPLTGRLVHILSHPGVVWCVAFSADGSRLVTGCSDEYARLWDVATGKLAVAPLRHVREHPEWKYNDGYNRPPEVRRAVFSPDGLMLMTGTYDHRVQIWNLATHAVVSRSDVGTNYSAIAFDPGGRRVLTQSVFPRLSPPQIREAATLVATGPVFAQRHQLTSICTSPDGRSILTASLRLKAARLLDSSTGEPIAQGLLHRVGVTEAAFTPDQQTIVTAGGDNTVRIWGVSWAPLEGRFFKHNPEAIVRFRPDGRSLMTGDKSSPNKQALLPDRVRLWDCTTGKPIGRPFEHAGATSSLAFTSDGAVYARGNWNSAQLFRSDNGKPLCDPMIHPNRVWAVAFTPDDRILATGCNDGRIRFWDWRTQRLIEPLVRRPGRVLWISFSPDGNLMATSSDTGSAVLLDARTHASVGKEIRHAQGVNSAVFDPEGKTLATSGDDGTIQFWSVPEGTPLPPPLPNIGGEPKAIFTPDGTRILTVGSEDTTRLWDFATRLPATRPLLRGAGCRADINRDGTLIAAVADDWSVHLWKAPKPVDGTPQQVTLQLETLLGATLGPDRQVRALEAQEWQNRARQLGRSD